MQTFKIFHGKNLKPISEPSDELNSFHWGILIIYIIEKQT